MMSDFAPIATYRGQSGKDVNRCFIHTEKQGPQVDGHWSREYELDKVCDTSTKGL